MNRRRELTSSIETALPSMPTVLAELIAEYGLKLPHVWMPDGIGPAYRLQTESTVCQMPPPRLIDRYQKIVSTATMYDGDLNWSVNVGNVDDDVMIGLTTGKTNYNGDDSTVLFGDGLLLQFYGKVNIYKNGCRYQTHNRTTAKSDGATVRFAADPVICRITVQSDGIENGQPIVFFDAKNDAEFRSIRPCVLLDGPATASVVSGLVL